MMHFLAIAVLVASAVSASSAAAPVATSTSACAAQNILDACLETENNLLNSCGTNDWNCKCNAYRDIVTCYNNCPMDQAVDTAQGQVQIFCGYASQYPSTTTTVAAKTGAATATTSTTTMATSTKGASSLAGSMMAASGTTGTTTGTAAAATVSSSGAGPLLGAGSMLMTVAGMIAALF
ncbi:hypothetical protein SEPCBS57363_004152 [Sporothrix epigloea]|uniref:GPI anchored serine-threonineeeee rich protein n=1 Tax=Sporothrix epigloea TaxID=1892477 RepID=A0ABP0DUA0_9PEZI